MTTETDEVARSIFYAHLEECLKLQSMCDARTFVRKQFSGPETVTIVDNVAWELMRRVNQRRKGNE